MNKLHATYTLNLRNTVFVTAKLRKENMVGVLLCPP